jgi:phosphatidylglycerophosphatase A
VAVLLGVLIHRLGHFPLLALATVAVTVLGFWAIGRELANRPGEDPSEIVIDEVAGQWLALCFPSAGFWFAGLDATNFPYPGWVAAFLFFRLFDIWKPWHVGRADQRGDATGVMTDDLWAGLYAGIATIIAAGLSHGLMRMM